MGTDNWSLHKLEFNIIRDKLADYTATSLGREIAEDLLPSSDLNLVLIWQQETTEARKLLEQGRQLTFTGITDLRLPLKKAERGGMLNADELNAVAKLLEVSAHIRSTLAELQEDAPRLSDMGRALQGFNGIKSEIRKAVSRDGEIRDTASSKLSALRRKTSNLNQQIRDRLDHFIRSSSYRQYLQEPIVTIREGRYVIPVRQEYRSHITGVVHDSSASGATLFIEPSVLVELGNELKVIKRETEAEIEKILSVLSGLVAANADELLNELNICAELDFIIAKALYSQNINAAAPDIGVGGQFSFLQARHPLIAPKNIVPIDIHLGEEFRTLIITGPNTGGKTVALKTAGLLTLMAQSGLHIPAAKGSQASVFDQVMADIGDEQSIEQSLSTFSSHMKNIINILESQQGYSLILLDELGAGTDPSEGSALATAILYYLHSQNKVRTIATTHYSDLKVFAYNEKEVENASVEFNEKTLSPTFHLLIGVPGRSNAISIASRLGLSADVVSRARSLIGIDQQGIEDMVEQISDDHRRLREDVQAAEEARQRHETAAKRAENELEILKEKQRREIEQAQEEARKIVTDARRRSEAAVKEARRIVRRAETIKESDLDRYAQDVFRPLTELENKIGGITAPKGKSVNLNEIIPGRQYMISSLQQQGKVLRIDTDKGEVEMQVGVMRVTVPAADLEEVKTERNNIRGMPLPKGYNLKKDLKFSPDLDLRGLNLEEATAKVEKHLDDALIAGINHVYIIHGKGTGRLRRGLQVYLKTHPSVASYRLGREGEGDSGVTVVTLS